MLTPERGTRRGGEEAARRPRRPDTRATGCRWIGGREGPCGAIGCCRVWEAWQAGTPAAPGAAAGGGAAGVDGHDGVRGPGGTGARATARALRRC